jgi:colanic acid biosynthesis protein WcaH
MAFTRGTVYRASPGIQGGTMTFILREKYAEIIEVLPILCVDILVRNTAGEYLLIKRENEPKKGFWWPIGGRVLKGEKLEDAVRRKIVEETAVQVRDVRPIGYFETVADANPFDLPFQYHAVSVVFTALVDDQQRIKLDEQSSEWKFSSELPQSFSYRAIQPMMEHVFPQLKKDQS